MACLVRMQDEVLLARGVLPYIGYIVMCGPKGYGLFGCVGHKYTPVGYHL